MALCLLGVIQESADRVRVAGAVHYKPEKLSAKQRDAGVMLDGLTEKDVPKPEMIKGKNPVLYANPKTGKLWFEYEDRPLTQEELMVELIEKLDLLLVKQDALISLLQAETEKTA